MPVVAVIFDFDDTLVPDSTSAFLNYHGIDPIRFWNETAKDLIDEAHDPAHAYLNAILREARPGGALAGVTNDDLRAFGAKLDDQWFPGLPDVLDDLKQSADAHRDLQVEFYIISGGLQPILDGSAHVQNYFTDVYGCQLGEDLDGGGLAEIRRCVTFTEKTRFIFEINKGIRPVDTATSPYLVNQKREPEDRRVSMQNMIFVGDGLTDVPCFSLIEQNGGKAFGVFQPGEESAKQSFQRLVETPRVRSINEPDYNENAALGSLLRLAVEAAIANIELQEGRAV